MKNDDHGFSGQSFTTATERSQHLAAAVTNALSSDRAVRILDIGCGDGTTLITLAKRLPNATGLGIDISELNVACAEEARARLSDADRERVGFVNADIMAWRPEGLFDVICMDSVLYLLPGATNAVIGRIASLLAPGGILVHNTPIECLRNRAIVAMRAMLRALRGPRLDELALRIARVLHKHAWSDASLRERLLYLYLVPERLLGTEVRDELERCGLSLEREEPVEPASLAQLRHSLSVWRKTDPEVTIDTGPSITPRCPHPS